MDEDPQAAATDRAVCVHRTNDRDSRRGALPCALPAALLGSFSRDRRTYPWLTTEDRAWKQSDDANVYIDLSSFKKKTMQHSILYRNWATVVLILRPKKEYN